MSRNTLTARWTLAWAIAAILSPLPASAQTLPGMGDAKGAEINSEYTAHLMRSARDAFQAIQDAWVADNPDRVASLMARDVVFTVPGETGRRGRDAVQGLLTQTLPRQSGLTLGTQILDGAGDVAFVLGRYQVKATAGPGGGDGDGGYHFTVLYQTSRTFEVRNQLFVSDFGAPDIWAVEDTPEPLPPVDLAGEMGQPGRVRSQAQRRLAEERRQRFPQVAAQASEFADAWGACDVTRLLAYAADDVFLLTMDGSVEMGPEAIRAALADPASGFGHPLYLSPVDFIGSTETTVLHTRFYLQDEVSGQALAQGPLLLVFEQTGSDVHLRGVVFSREN